MLPAGLVCDARTPYQSASARRKSSSISDTHFVRHISFTRNIKNEIISVLTFLAKMDLESIFWCKDGFWKDTPQIESIDIRGSIRTSLPYRAEGDGQDLSTRSSRGASDGSTRHSVPECNRMWGICSRAVVSNVFSMCGLNLVSMSIIISFPLNL